MAELVECGFDYLELLVVKGAHFFKKAVKNRAYPIFRKPGIGLLALLCRREDNVFSVADDAVFLYEPKLKQMLW